MTSIYYNEWGKNAAKWLEKAMKAGFIPKGDVDTRSITEIKSEELLKYDQCHFFAGIGGWVLALQYAGWDNSKKVWTGSCPCQPFSSAGSRKGKQDERHLWPFWKQLIQECKPPVVFGEQVADAIAFGWLDEVCDDLENLSYATASAILPACSVTAPHQRYRLFFVGDSKYNGQHVRKKQGTIKEKIWKKETFDESSRNGAFPLMEHFKDMEYIRCPDGKRRGIKPGISLLYNGISPRIREIAIRGFGNAIVPQVAGEFIIAYLETIDDKENKNV